jgi:hypothetical protein
VHGQLERIPDSLYFFFERDGTTGRVIRSEANQLTLKIDPIVNQLSESSGTRRIQSTTFEEYEKAFNWGFFRWPQRWTIEVRPKSTNRSTTGQLTLYQVSRENQGNWIFGGFAMTVVKGELSTDGTTILVFGFVELIKQQTVPVLPFRK